jgi:tRNA(Ile2) C34 agmatinyltransferase TiaS
VSVGYHLSESNAGRSCGLCGGRATAYLHEVGFRCGECHEAAPRRLARSGGVL